MLQVGSLQETHTEATQPMAVSTTWNSTVLTQTSGPYPYILIYSKKSACTEVPIQGLCRSFSPHVYPNPDFLGVEISISTAETHRQLSMTHTDALTNSLAVAASSQTVPNLKWLWTRREPSQQGGAKRRIGSEILQNMESVKLH